MPSPIHPYQNLSPDCVLNAIEDKGYACDGHLLALNSYENRVYRVGIVGEPSVVAKFYRPNRWSNEAILEEHHFSKTLAEREIPVVPPLADSHDNTLFEFNGYRFALYLNRPGRAPDLDNKENLEWLGRFIGRIHAVGSVKKYSFRPTLNVITMGDDSLKFLLENHFLPVDLQETYQSVAFDVLQRLHQCFDQIDHLKIIRLHGDCHPGNILWTEAGPHFVDFDDSCMGPAIQDLWMLLAGDRAHMTFQLSHVLKGYREFLNFDLRELYLIEALRSLRMIHYSAWLAKRWNDPAFPVSFPWFNTQRYWQDQILALREQLALMDEPVLEVIP